MNEINIHPAASGAGYSALLQSVADVLRKARGQVARTVGHIQLQAYWQIGRYIVEYEQQGRERAAYGEEILGRLSKDLTLRFGRGFNRNTLQYMRRFYIAYPNCTTLSCKLSWSHYIEILKAEDPLEISFYVKQCERENWSVRELKRQMKSMLFHRIALSRDKEQVLALAAEGMEARHNLAHGNAVGQRCPPVIPHCRRGTAICGRGDAPFAVCLLAWGALPRPVYARWCA